MKSKPVIRSDAESAATESCTRRGQRDVSFTTANSINLTPSLLERLISHRLVSLTLGFSVVVFDAR